MVQGTPELRRRFGRIPEELQRQLRPELAKAADRIVRTMNALKPIPEIDIKWVWGPPPGGSLSIGRVASASEDREFISIFATATTSEFPGGFPAVARWFEFGTFERFHKGTGKSTGAISAKPYFFPAYRANKNAVRLAIGRKVRQAIKAL